MRGSLRAALLVAAFGCQPGDGSTASSDGGTSTGASAGASDPTTAGASATTSPGSTGASATTSATGTSGASELTTADMSEVTSETGSSSAGSTGADASSSGGSTGASGCEEPEWPPEDPYGACQTHGDCPWGYCQVMIGYSRCVPTAIVDLECETLWCPPGPGGMVLPNAGTFPPSCSLICLSPEDCAEGSECVNAACWWPSP